MDERLQRLLVQYEDVIRVLQERRQSRTPLQAPTALAAIRDIERIRDELAAAMAQDDADARKEGVLRAGLALQTATEALEDCAGEAFPRTATNLYGIAEELQRLGRQ